MSLKLLFTITLSGLLVLILSIVFFINIHNFQKFIEHQVYSTSQDTVYSLGMSLSTLDSSSSSDDVELMVNAIFDSGYYEYIRFYDLNNTLIYENTLPLVVKDVPSWYISLVSLELKEAVGDVNSGWQKRGTLAVKGHAGYAYYELYQNFESLLYSFAIISFISFIVLISIINILLHSLKRIREQANAINEHKFIIEKDSTFINEFDLLIKTMNKMVSKVEGIFKSEVKIFEQYQNVLYKDEETQLENKKYFTLKLQEILDDETRNLGYIAIISIDGLDKLKAEQGYGVYKKSLLQFIANIPIELRENNLLARISEHEIAVLFTTHNLELIEGYFHSLQSAMNITNKHLTSKEKLLCYSIGVAPYFENDKISETLSRVDYSLSRSQINGCNIIDIYDDSKNKQKLITQGKNSWKVMFEKIFNENKIVLAMQSVVNDTTEYIFHDEALIRIKEDDGSLQTAGYYLPMANALEMVAKFDDVVIKNIIPVLHEYVYPVAFNISKDYVLQSLYLLDLSNMLSTLHKSNAHMLHFECSENEVLLELDSYIEFSDMIHSHKQLFGIDRFSGIENISYIEKVRPDYIKINVNFIIESHTNNRAALDTLNILAQTMGTTIIITAVQSKEQHEKLKEIGYENFQGRYISDIKL